MWPSLARQNAEVDHLLKPDERWAGFINAPGS